MADCGETAILIITLTPAGTSTNVARRRLEIRCELDRDHDGPHRNTEHHAEWESGKPLILRHEDELA
jgi:hypothetical protein